MTDINNNEKKILDYITVSGYETDAAGNLIIKTTMSDSCEMLVRKMDSRNFLSRALEIKPAPVNGQVSNTTEPGYLFSIHEFFTDILLADLSEHPDRLDIGTISFASRTYNQQKNVRSIYTWTGKSAESGTAPSSLREICDLVSYSVATFDDDGMYRLRMYKNGSKQLHNIVLSLLGKPEEDVLSRPDKYDYLISPEEFDVKALEEIRQKQDSNKNCVTYTFTYNQLRDNVLVDMSQKVELDIPENCLLVVDGNVLSDAKHIKIIEKFDIASCPNNSLIVFDAEGSMALFDRYDDERVYFIHMFDASLGTMVEHYNPDYKEFNNSFPRLAKDEDIRVYNSKIRSVRLKYNPETRSVTPMLNSLKPGDLYYRPEFDALAGRFICKKFRFQGSADEFTIIVDRKLGFKNKEKCETLVRTYNANLNEAIKQTSNLSDLE